MDAMGNQPDEVTRAALDAVSEAVELADREERQHAAVRGRGVRGRVRRLLARRPARAENAKGIRRLNATLAAAARRGAHVTGRGVSAGGRWLSARVLAMAPRLPVRDAATLRAQFPGLSPDELASALIAGASRASGAIGMAAGACARRRGPQNRRGGPDWPGARPPIERGVGRAELPGEDRQHGPPGHLAVTLPRGGHGAGPPAAAANRLEQPFGLDGERARVRVVGA